MHLTVFDTHSLGDKDAQMLRGRFRRRSSNRGFGGLRFFYFRVTIEVDFFRPGKDLVLRNRDKRCHRKT